MNVNILRNAMASAQLPVVPIEFQIQIAIDDRILLMALVTKFAGIVNAGVWRYISILKMQLPDNRQFRLFLKRRCTVCRANPSAVAAGNNLAGMHQQTKQDDKDEKGSQYSHP